MLCEPGEISLQLKAFFLKCERIVYANARRQEALSAEEDHLEGFSPEVRFLLPTLLPFIVFLSSVDWRSHGLPDRGLRI